MPYKLQKTDEGYWVINTETGERKNKKALEKGRASRYMRALYAVEGGAEMGKKVKELVMGLFGHSEEAAPSLFVFKDKSGASRWVTYSSNAYQDRDKEFVSTQALEADVLRADQDGEYGPLRWWHYGTPDLVNQKAGPGADIGKCDYNAMHGRILVESGTFANDAIAAAVEKAAPDLQVSIGYFHPQSEPDGAGVFHRIKRFERSLLPAGRASNPFTAMTVIQQKSGGADMLSEKIKALKALLGDDELVQSVLSQAEAKEKAADALGVAFKGEGEPEPEPVIETPEVEAVATAAVEIEAKAEAGESEEEGELEAVIGDMTPQQFAGLLSEAMTQAMEPYSARVAKLEASATKKDDSEAALREAVEAQASTIKELKSQLDELTGSQPRSATRPYRASQDDATVVKDTSRVKGSQPTIDQGFVSMITGQQ